MIFSINSCGSYRQSLPTSKQKASQNIVPVPKIGFVKVSSSLSWPSRTWLTVQKSRYIKSSWIGTIARPARVISVPGANGKAKISIQHETYLRSNDGPAGMVVGSSLWRCDSGLEVIAWHWQGWWAREYGVIMLGSETFPRRLARKGNCRIRLGMF